MSNITTETCVSNIVPFKNNKTNLSKQYQTSQGTNSQRVFRSKITKQFCQNNTNTSQVTNSQREHDTSAKQKWKHGNRHNRKQIEIGKHKNRDRETQIEIGQHRESNINRSKQLHLSYKIYTYIYI